MAKIYTKKGDNGRTSLYSFEFGTISKDETIIVCLGALDELSANIGVLCSFLGSELYYTEIKQLRTIQTKLLDIGSNIATTVVGKRTTKISLQDVKNIENWIDEYEKTNKPLREFILVGVNPPDSYAHVCRAVCRRMETNFITLKNENKERPWVEAEILCYINRLSDYFFVLSRHLSKGQEMTRTEANKLLA